MKYLVVLALCATAFALEKEFADFEAACLTESNLNKADLGDENKVKNACYRECLLKKVGLMKQDGTIDLDVLLKDRTTPETKEEASKEINKAIKHCQAQTGTDSCKLAHCFHGMLFAN